MILRRRVVENPEALDLGLFQCFHEGGQGVQDQNAMPDQSAAYGFGMADFR